MVNHYWRPAICILLAAVLTYAYVDTWQNNPAFFVQEVRQTTNSWTGVGGTALSVGISINLDVSVVRNYYGMFELPLYVGGTSYDTLHQGFFTAMTLLILIPILLEVREWKSEQSSKQVSIQ